MRFIFHSNNQLPALSWLAKMSKGNADVEVWLGCAVERNSRFFVAGVWDGDFERGDFDKSQFACCTGALLLGNDRIKFVTPNHTQEALFVIKRENEFYISNSAAFVCAITSESLSNKYLHYEEDFCSLLFGKKKCKDVTPLNGGQYLQMYRCCNIVLDSHLNVSTEDKSEVSPFADYESYVLYLEGTLQKIFANSRFQGRRCCYGSISTISRGYDAPAVSALAKKVGCQAVVTYNSPKKYIEDNGRDIALKLGYDHIYEVDADEFKTNEEYLEAEAASSGCMTTAEIMAHKNIVCDKLLLVGTRGDSIWNKNHRKVNNDYDFSEGNQFSLADSSYVESALKNNTIVIHVPLIGGVIG